MHFFIVIFKLSSSKLKFQPINVIRTNGQTCGFMHKIASIQVICIRNKEFILGILFLFDGFFSFSSICWWHVLFYLIFSFVFFFCSVVLILLLKLLLKLLLLLSSSIVVVYVHCLSFGSWSTCMKSWSHLEIGVATIFKYGFTSYVFSLFHSQSLSFFTETNGRAETLRILNRKCHFVRTFWFFKNTH